ncbi:N-6 DNA methylase [Pseudomonas sp. A4002]|uniref:HsdM family class I SAM-dependent methyltransferase n=1 Tax=unclassified Pseudomonas TaxID=196821 RepID=UPI0015A2F1E0|nr:N-6 DNA methylase [Pseudomonas sp. A4002]NWB81089.1 N-6 DNA methylase [Pseudomonas sp. F9001]
MNNDFLEKIERSRVSTINEIAAEKKKLAEQYFTPARVSAIMAEMFSARPGQTVSVLDPCCGVGNLSAAVLNRAQREHEHALFTLIEKDGFLAKLAKDNFFDIADTNVIHSDFFDCFPKLSTYDRIILNPPYSKILAGTDIATFCINHLGYKEANIYSAFVSCCLKLLSDDGELIAIIPRSFCNGPLFKGFRNSILKSYYLQEIYLFESRKIFWDSSVLQEVMILKISKENVEFVRISHEKNNGQISTKEICRDKVYFKGDSQKFIHIPLAAGDDELLSKIAKFSQTLLTLGLRASTGKVVDFRCGDWLLERKGKRSSFLLYQDSIGLDASIAFGRGVAAKRRYIKVCDESMSVLIPRQNYILVRRISFKESSTRIVAAPFLEKSYEGEYLGVENHLNYIWGEKVKLSGNVCVALFAYLSTKTIDSYIRRFSGHTQINAADLNSIPIPGLAELESFGEHNADISMSELVIKAEENFFRDA